MASKPRRRRGGRNRRREGAPAASAAVSPANGQGATGSSEGSRAPRGERRPPRDRPAGEAVGGNAGRPSRQVAVTAGAGRTGEGAPAKKPGLLSRLTRLFTGR
jgi:ATP-dependent RNA helicase RhlB